MEATFLSSPFFYMQSHNPKLPLRRSSIKPRFHNKNGLNPNTKLVVNGKQGENSGESVDKNSIILRMRIKKMKALEASKNQDRTRLSSSDSNERERKLLSQNHEDVIEAMKVLQSYFTKTRPGVALGMLALVTMSLSLSSQPDLLAIVFKVAKELLAGCHVCIDIDF